MSVAVLVSPKQRVRHLAVWAPGVGPLCRNRGYARGWDYDPYNTAYEHLPWCTVCHAEARAMHLAVTA